MTNCESCIHKAVCKKYINDGIPPKMREKMIEAGCGDYMPYDVDKQNVTELMLRVQELESGKPKAYWIGDEEGFYTCSACNDICDWGGYDYYPNCGAEME